MRFFDMRNPFWRFLGKLFDVVILNLLWTVCSLPLITIGAATAAVYAVCIGIIHDDVSGTAKAFFHVLRRDWRQTAPMGLILFGFMALLGFDLWYFLLAQQWLEGGLRLAVCAFLTVAFIVVAATAVFAFALSAVFDNTVGKTLRNALLMALRHPVRSLGMMAISLGIAAAAVLSLIYIPLLSIIFLMFGPALGIFLHCLVLLPVLSPYLPDDTEVPFQNEEEME